MRRKCAQFARSAAPWTYSLSLHDALPISGRRGRNATGPTLVNVDEEASRAAWRTSPEEMSGRESEAWNTCSHHPLQSQGDPVTMLQKLIERRHKGQEEGFTLIELMVVVLISEERRAGKRSTFRGARTQSKDRQAQSNLSNASAHEQGGRTDS